jgi:hypothetical protein
MYYLYVVVVVVVIPPEIEASAFLIDNTIIPYIFD